MERTIELDSLTFAQMLRGGAQSLGKDRQRINDLNVFPIPDGDTGDNMYMTLRAGTSAIEGHLGTLSEVSAVASSGMLLGARGNSGVILSRIFAGLSKGLKGCVTASADDFALAMQSAVSEAYGALSTPVEGTIITVLREGVEAARQGTGDFNGYFGRIVPAMEESLAQTPEKLQVLRDNGVVDSGGAGLLCIFQGMKDVLEGEAPTEGETLPTPAPLPQVDLSKFGEDSVLEFGYCTEFLLRLMSAKVGDVDSFDENEIIKYLEEVGESVVAFREGSIVKVHVHTFTPGEILSHCQRYGEFLTLKIENMTLQHHQTVGRETSPQRARPEKFAIVAVAPGEGLASAFEEIGTDVVIRGGQSMNPSTGDFLEAFSRTGAGTILVFPNNPNIIMAAQQAATLYHDAHIDVVPSKTIGQGYWAIASLDRSVPDHEQILRDATEAMQDVTDGMVSRAVRDADSQQVEVHSGDFVGYSGKTILSDSPSRKEAALSLCDKLGASTKDVLLLFHGEDVPEEEAVELCRELSAKYPLLEVIPRAGLQPVYDYIFVLN